MDIGAEGWGWTSLAGAGVSLLALVANLYVRRADRPEAQWHITAHTSNPGRGVAPEDRHTTLIASATNVGDGGAYAVKVGPPAFLYQRQGDIPARKDVVPRLTNGETVHVHVGTCETAEGEVTPVLRFTLRWVEGPVRHKRERSMLVTVQADPVEVQTGAVRTRGRVRRALHLP